jgi:hypothetical protein
VRGVSIAIRAFSGSLLLLEERLQLRDHVEIFGAAVGAFEDNKAPQRNTQKVDAIRTSRS